MSDPHDPTPPVLSYYTPPKPRRWRLNTRFLVLAMAALLLGSLVPMGVWLLTLGPKLPTIVAYKPQGFTDARIAIAIADKIGVGEYGDERYRRVVDYLRGYGITIIDGAVPTGRSEQAILDSFRIDEVREDSYLSETWHKLPTGWLAISPSSIRFWPDQGVWHTETWWNSTHGPRMPRAFPEGLTYTFYQLPGDMYGEVAGQLSWGFGPNPPGPARHTDWQSPTALRLGLWSAMLLGVVLSLTAFRTRRSGNPRYLLPAALIWLGLMVGLFACAGYTIVPLGNVFQVWLTPPKPPAFHSFGELLASTAAAVLLCIALLLHRNPLVVGPRGPES